MLAAERGSIAVIDALLSHDALVDVQNSVCCSHDSVIRLIHVRNVRCLLCCVLQYGLTALMLAAERGYIAVVNALLVCNALVDVQNTVRCLRNCVSRQKRIFDKQTSLCCVL